MALLRAIVTVGGLTLVSRITGFARDILIARFLGAGLVADAFVAAFKFPNLFRRLFAEGAFNAAFVPLYAGRLAAEGDDAARRFAAQAQSGLGLLLLLVVIAMELAMPWAMVVLAPGFGDLPGKLGLATELARITFPYLLCISVVALLSGVLNAHGRFAAAAFAPVLLNVALMTALLVGVPALETAGHALAWGVFAAGVLQLLWLVLMCARAGVLPPLCRPRWTPQVRLLARRTVPGIVGGGVYQLNLLVDTILASLVADGALSWLYYADRINQLPLGVVGVAAGTALLPMLSRALGAGDAAGAVATHNRALEFTLLLSLPAAAALVVSGPQIVSALFERGAFGPADTSATAGALGAFAMGIPAYVLIKALAPGFFAREDTATPVRVAVVALIANIVLNLILMGPLGHVGIALATALSAWLNVTLLTVLLIRRGAWWPDRRLLVRGAAMIVASAGMAGALWAAERWGPLPELAGSAATVDRISGIVLLVIGGVVSYGALALLLGAARPSDFKALIQRRRPPA